MILNSQFSNFLFEFPKNFFYKDIKTKYNSYIKKLPIPFDNITDFINWSIQSVSWPAISIETVSQLHQHTGVFYKPGEEITRYFNKQIDVTLKTTEGFLNYFILQDQLSYYFSHDASSELGSESVFLPDLSLHLLDFQGNLILTQIYKDVVFSGISELELSYASNVPEFKTFNITFNYSTILFKQELQ